MLPFFIVSTLFFFIFDTYELWPAQNILIPGKEKRSMHFRPFLISRVFVPLRSFLRENLLEKRWKNGERAAGRVKGEKWKRKRVWRLHVLLRIRRMKAYQKKGGSKVVERRNDGVRSLPVNNLRASILKLPKKKPTMVGRMQKMGLLCFDGLGSLQRIQLPWRPIYAS